MIFVIKLVVRFRHKTARKVNTIAPGQELILKGLQVDGYAPLGMLLDAQQCEEIIQYLSDKPLRDRDRSLSTFLISDAPQGLRIADHDLRDIVNCPHVMDLANSPLLVGLASQYIGCKPTISNIVVRWSLPELDGTSVLQTFHRDCDDWKFFKVMVYLTDVGETEGPHVFVRGTHKTRAPIMLRFLDDDEVSLTHGAENLLVATGKSGFGFAVDTSGVHKGAAPSRRARLMLQFQYSLLPCFAYTYEPAICKGNSELDRYINRLMIG